MAMLVVRSRGHATGCAPAVRDDANVNGAPLGIAVPMIVLVMLIVAVAMFVEYGRVKVAVLVLHNVGFRRECLAKTIQSETIML
jgi:hypothetical protein